MRNHLMAIMVLFIFAFSFALIFACSEDKKGDDDDDDTTPHPQPDDDAGDDDGCSGAYPIDCGNGNCCPSSYPVCCPEICCLNGWYCCGGDGCCHYSDDDTDDDTVDDDQPDLVVEAFSYYVEYCWESGYIDFDYVRICNVGDADAGSVYGAVHIRDADLWGWRLSGGFTTGSIDARDCDTINDLSFDVDFTGDPDGWYYIWVEIDEFDDEAESDESNNWTRSSESYYWEDCLSGKK